jgi:hypothetical protein
VIWVIVTNKKSTLRSGILLICYVIYMFDLFERVSARWSSSHSLMTTTPAPSSPSNEDIITCTSQSILPQNPTQEQLHIARELLFNNDAKKRRLAKLAKALSYNYDITRGPSEQPTGHRRRRKPSQYHKPRGGRSIKAGSRDGLKDIEAEKEDFYGLSDARTSDSEEVDLGRAGSERRQSLAINGTDQHGDIYESSNWQQADEGEPDFYDPIDMGSVDNAQELMTPLQRIGNVRSKSPSILSDRDGEQPSSASPHTSPLAPDFHLDCPASRCDKLPTGTSIDQYFVLFGARALDVYRYELERTSLELIHDSPRDNLDPSQRQH